MKKRIILLICLSASFVLFVLGTKKVSVNALIQDNTEALVETLYNVFGEEGFNITTTNFGEYVGNSRKKGFRLTIEDWAVNDIPFCKGPNVELDRVTGQCWVRLITD